MTDYQKWLERVDNLLQVQRDRCLDLISANFTRRELIELKMMIEVLMEKALEQEPKTGHWISHYDESTKEGWYECDRCHTERAFNTKFCPDCGARMVESEE